MSSFSLGVARVDRMENECMHTSEGRLLLDGEGKAREARLGWFGGAQRKVSEQHSGRRILRMKVPSKEAWRKTEEEMYSRSDGGLEVCWCESLTEYTPCDTFLH